MSGYQRLRDGIQWSFGHCGYAHPYGFPPLSRFIASAMNDTQSYENPSGSVALLNRQERDYDEVLPPASWHGLFLGAFIIAHKFLSDGSPKNQRWMTVGQSLSSR
ncbi:hypothetical protein BD410DRAFT_792455 [Rickenella mellea]|uniref:Uncharacterized protein n=1 Tax=Rickenella mellea TaxID=50990 RepID=A0A4Y7PX76_9AGAM|nr:hypothetical protein BD410DRAFT_792455 [Rickenella mellea]